MDFLLGILVGVGFGFLWGVWRATQSFIERIIERPEEIREIMARVERAAKEDTEESPSQDPQSEIKQEYRTEWHQGICYLYDHNDNFMAQGADVIEAMKNAEKRFPKLNLSFRVNDPDKSRQ